MYKKKKTQVFQQQNFIYQPVEVTVMTRSRGRGELGGRGTWKGMESWQEEGELAGGGGQNLSISIYPKIPSQPYILWQGLAHYWTDRKRWCAVHYCAMSSWQSVFLTQVGKSDKVSRNRINKPKLLHRLV